MQRLTESILSVRHCWMLDLALLLSNMEVLPLLPSECVYKVIFYPFPVFVIFSHLHTIDYDASGMKDNKRDDITDKNTFLVCILISNKCGDKLHGKSRFFGNCISFGLLFCYLSFVLYTFMQFISDKTGFEILDCTKFGCHSLVNQCDWKSSIDCLPFYPFLPQCYMFERIVKHFGKNTYFLPPKRYM